jgi:hypothetical protein
VDQFQVSELLSTMQGIDGNNQDYYHIKATTNKGAISLHLDAESGTTNFLGMKDVAPLSVFPLCVQDIIEKRRDDHAAAEKPSSKEEADEFMKEVTNPLEGGEGHSGLKVKAKFEATNLMAKGVSDSPINAHGEYSLGHIDEPERVKQYAIKLAVASKTTSQSDYSPFTGDAAACLSTFPARNQGTCGRRAAAPAHLQRAHRSICALYTLSRRRSLCH